MRKIRIWLLVALVAAGSGGLRAAVPGADGAIRRGRELFDLGRWSDARHEFLEARKALTPAERSAVQETDFYLAACAVELGSADAEGALREFEQRYPG